MTPEFRKEKLYVVQGEYQITCTVIYQNYVLSQVNLGKLIQLLESTVEVVFLALGF